ncbi:MAG TPA: hypothetical protein VHZ55_26215 [Bryobacteraceae bacterium]|jgi:hypothetical protein|nr:hypothetical protein [Bryobacteraceae bacterium]
MRTKKALKQLSKAEALITTVSSRYIDNTPQLRQLLDSAVAIIGQATGALDNQSSRSGGKPAQSPKKQDQATGSEGTATPAFSGNKTEFIRALVEARGAGGAVPKDIADVFTARHIGRSENLIYNALSTLVKQKKLKKQGGRYFAISMKSNAKSVAPQKHRISPQGLKRIIQGNKRRWARHRAAQTTQTPAVSRLTRPLQKAVPPRKAIGKTIPAKRSTRKT